MAKCNFCKRAVKWIQVDNAGRLKWIAVDPRSKPRTQHKCEKLKPSPDDKPRTIDDPWWLRD